VLQLLQAKSNGVEADSDSEVITIQSKLAVNSPGDIYEQEADQLAEQSLQMSEPLQSPCACGGGCSKCQTHAHLHKQQHLQAKQVASSAAGQTVAPPSVHEVLASPGHPLEESTRAFFEPRFGQDLSHVRIHTGKQATESALAVGAMAYTVGNGIVFEGERYSPHTRAGQQLLAHELVHTLQQAKGSATGTEVSNSRDPEQEADRASRAVMGGKQANITTAASAHTLHRQPLPNATRPLRATPQLLGSEVVDSFALNSATLTKDQTGRLAIFVHTLKSLLHDYPNALVKITGHTDASGDEKSNERLGQRRADAVGDFLVGAGIPGDAIVTLSAGETELRVKTEKPEPRNRRAHVRFEPEPRGRSLFSTEPSESGPKVPPPDQTCKNNPDSPVCKQVSEPGKGPTDSTQGRPGGVPTDCVASQRGFKHQPEALRKVIAKKGVDPEEWFASVDRAALAAVYNRLCPYGLWDYITDITRITPGEKPVGDTFEVGGLTPVVHFTGDEAGLKKALNASPNFCEATGLGNKLHQLPSWREISSSGSLHITVAPGGIEAHVDVFSPTPDATGRVCSNAPTTPNLTHIFNEPFAEWFRKLTGIPGVQVTPPPARPPAVPEGAVTPEPFRETTDLSWKSLLGILLDRARVTLHFGSKPRRRIRSDAPPLPSDVEQMLDQQIPTHIPIDALIPAGVKNALAEATAKRENAGPEEEPALIAALNAAQERFDAVDIDAHEVAKDVARKMAQAAQKGSPAFLIDLGPEFLNLSPADHKFIRTQVRDIARLVRAMLIKSEGVKVGGVYKIGLWFGGQVVMEVDF
jgi:outer membrane protein OmpA-like peptidoglycan-associated protein